MTILFRSHLKKRIFVQDQGGSEFQPAAILKYVEDLKRGPNTDIGAIDLFEMVISSPRGKRGSSCDAHAFVGRFDANPDKELKQPTIVPTIHQDILAGNVTCLNAGQKGSGSPEIRWVTDGIAGVGRHHLLDDRLG